MIPERIEQTYDQLVMQFVANCVEWVAEALDSDYLTIFRRMDKVGLIDGYIMKCYDVLHLESRQNITKDIIETLEIWEKQI